MFKCSHCSNALKLETAMEPSHPHEHFKGKDAIHHIAEVQAEGIITSNEIHGAETPGVLFACMDAARETAVALVLISLSLSFLELAIDEFLAIVGAFSLSWMIWKVGRASWLAWSRLERLHRVMEEERYEIEVNRDQEREELKALYQAKGFQGKLLDDAVDVLMADGDRLLRVMLEEELGFRLEENEHPLLQGLGAGVGALFASLVMLGAYALFALPALFVAGGLMLALAAALSAKLEKNKVIPAMIWNLGITVFCSTVAYCCMKYILT